MLDLQRPEGQLWTIPSDFQVTLTGCCWGWGVGSYAADFPASSCHLGPHWPSCLLQMAKVHK